MNREAGYAYIWRYQVSPEKAAQFEELYGPRGGWAKLFAKSVHYCGTELLSSGQGWYWTVDRWTTRQAHKSFVRSNQTEFEELDKRGESLTVCEELMGEFQIVG